MVAAPPFRSNGLNWRYPTFGPCILIQIITICASTAENRIVSSSTSSNAISPASVINAVHSRDSWTSFRTAFASGRCDSTSDPLGELDCGAGHFGHDGWTARHQPSRFGRPIGSGGSSGLVNVGGASTLFAESPPPGTGLSLSAEQLQQHDSALMRAYFSRAMAHLQVLHAPLAAACIRCSCVVSPCPLLQFKLLLLSIITV